LLVILLFLAVLQLIVYRKKQIQLIVLSQGGVLDTRKTHTVAG